MIQFGSVIKVIYSDDAINNEIRHIRAIVDTDQVVYKVWNKRMQVWKYHVESIFGFYLLFERGFLTVHKTSLHK